MKPQILTLLLTLIFTSGYPQEHPKSHPDSTNRIPLDRDTKIYHKADAPLDHKIGVKHPVPRARKDSSQVPRK